MVMPAKTVLILCLIVLLIGGSLGAAADHTFVASGLEAKLAASLANLEHTQANLAAEKAKPAPLPVHIAGATTQTIAYVDRPIYIDKATGQQVKDPDDIIATVGPQKLTMKMIGPTETRDYTFNKKVGEKWIFDQGQVQWTVNTTLDGTMDLRPMMEAYADAKVAANRTHVSLGAYLTNQGAVLSAGWQINKNVEIDGIIAVPDPKKLIGAGGTLHF